MPLKPLSEKDRLYFEMLRLYEQLGMILRDYQAATAKERPPQGKAYLVDPYTGKRWKDIPNQRKSPAAGSRRQRGSSRKKD